MIEILSKSQRIDRSRKSSKCYTRLKMPRATKFRSLSCGIELKSYEDRPREDKSDCEAHIREKRAKMKTKSKLPPIKFWSKYHAFATQNQAKFDFTARYAQAASPLEVLIPAHRDVSNVMMP